MATLLNIQDLNTGEPIGRLPRDMNGVQQADFMFQISKEYPHFTMVIRNDIGCELPDYGIWKDGKRNGISYKPSNAHECTYNCMFNQRSCWKEQFAE